MVTRGMLKYLLKTYSQDRLQSRFDAQIVDSYLCLCRASVSPSVFFFSTMFELYLCSQRQPEAQAKLEKYLIRRQCLTKGLHNCCIAILPIKTGEHFDYIMADVKAR